MEGILRFKMVELNNKSTLKHYKNTLKQLAPTVHRLIFGRVYFLFIYLFVYLFIYLFFLGGGGLIIGVLWYCKGTTVLLI